MSLRAGLTRQRPRRVLTRASTLLIGALLLGCSQNQTQVVATGEVAQDSGMQHHRLQVPVTATRLELDVHAAATAGEIVWVLTDPSGDVRASGAVISGASVGQRRTFPPVAGTWDLRIELREASGSYNLRLRARW